MSRLITQPDESSAVVPNSDGEDRIEPDSVADLYRQHAGEMRAFLAGVLRDRELADEVLQTVFRKALEKGHTATENIRSWLFKVAWNEAMLVRRVQTRQTSGLQKAARSRGVLEGVPEESEAAAVRQETVDQVRRAILQLPDEQQLVVRMRIYEEKKFAVIAEELGAPLGTILSRMRAAMMKLEKSLGRHLDE
ncbi:MAG: RNA polymerase sigma factor (sigma-70 family) [Planctomycetaceae bacterium]